MDCCDDNKEVKKPKGIWEGLLYGLLPHTGCMLFIVASVFGATVLMQFFKPLLMNRNFFYYLILISMGFATFSAFLYLKKHNSLSFKGVKKKKGYLTTMYGLTIGINIVLFFIIFPMVANITGNVSAEQIDELSMLKVKVDIPCPGHAPLISNEVQTILGVEGSQYSFPKTFEVYYDSAKTNKQEILALDVFEEFPAEVLDEEINVDYAQTSQQTEYVGSCSGGCGGPGTCGGGCGSSACGYN